MERLTPQYLSDYISFKYGSRDWKYSTQEIPDIPQLQAEGSAKLWNLLLDEKVALLADEVGMGKTYQALAIMITLWRNKPNAKVLIYAPNETVALKWVNEYNNFIRDHYKFSDDFIRSSIDNQPLRSAIYCESHLALLKRIKEGWASLLICKTSSLSNLLSNKISQNELDNLNLNLTLPDIKSLSDDEQRKWMIRLAYKSNEFAYSKIKNNGESPFDLIIFDEAHYLRNSESDTNRGLVARSFFAGKMDGLSQNKETRYLAEKALLLTATPNHSSEKNISSIVGVFTDEFKGKDPREILNRICVRRFRRLNNKTKHQYRKELERPVEMNSLQEKIFFATYHKSLIKYRASLPDTVKRKGYNKYRILIGYLEGFEFLAKGVEKNSREKNNGKDNAVDFTEREDQKIINELCQIHQRMYGVSPIHPKYTYVTKLLSETNILHPDKKLVFVRRIASVKDIANRVLEQYDLQYENILNEVKEFRKEGIKGANKFQLRKIFSDAIGNNDEEANDINENDAKGEEKEAEEVINSSRFLSQFTKLKEGRYKSTDCFNFRQRFLREDNIFSVFFHPGQDYNTKEYVLKHYFFTSLSGKEKRNYSITIQKSRFDRLPEKEKNSLSSFISFPEKIEKKSVEDGYNVLPTLLTIWFKAIRGDQNEEISKAIETYMTLSILEKEAFSKYLMNGLLFSSGFLISFYAYFKQIGSTVKKEKIYPEFCEAVEKDMLRNGLALLIARAINSFRIFYRKELGKTEETLYKENWSFLKHTAPVVPVSGGTSLKSLIKAFNTPFYPAALISTSVLQEGVDLHYHCNEVIHYGLAWTQGDNEQRVGRVDRLNGKMENALINHPGSILPIYYPYLKNSLDEDQTATFVLRKREAEKLIDQFIPVEQSTNIEFKNLDGSGWKSCFNSPLGNSYKIADPYPVISSQSFQQKILGDNKAGQKISGEEIISPIISVLHEEFGDELVVYTKEEQQNNNRLFAIKHIRKIKEIRHQPIIGELYYYEPGLFILETPVYCLRLKTPVYKRGYYKYDDLRYFGNLKEVYTENPILKIGFDRFRKDEFKYFVCADLPIFNLKNNKLNLSKDELLHVTHDLIKFSDELENKIQYHDDILNDSVIQESLKNPPSIKIQMPENRGALEQSGWRVFNNYYKKERKLPSSLETFDKIYEKNALNKFLKYFSRQEDHLRCVGFYKNDALDEERRFYEYLINNTD